MGWERAIFLVKKMSLYDFCRCVFHVSQLKKCHAEMADIPLRDTVPVEAIRLVSDLTYEEKPVKILEYASRVTRNKVIKVCKV